MDVCSGAIHVVDDVTYDVIALYEEKSLEEIELSLIHICQLQVNLERKYDFYQYLHDQINVCS